MYVYQWFQWLLFFYVYCFAGWCIESTYVSIKKKKLVNRGFLKVPLLPLYGSGAVMMLFVSIPVRDNLFLVFLFGMIAATVLEYVTGACMERLFKVKYWDYSNSKFQLHGYISLGTSLCWGLLSVLLIQVIHKPVETFIFNLDMKAGHILAVAISIIFITDYIASVRSALDLANILEKLTRLKTEWEEVKDQLDDIKLDVKKQLGDIYESTEQRLEEMKESAVDQVSSWQEYYEKQRSALSEKLKTLTEERERATRKVDSSKIRLLKRNPGATSKFGEALREIKEKNDWWSKKT